MKITANLIKNQGGILILDTGYQPNLEGDKFVIDIKPYKSARSLQQNRLMWSLIQDIAKHTGNDDMDIYITGLEHANAKSEFILALPETLPALRETFRAVKVVGVRTVNNKEMIACKCYIGSSKFDTSEMTYLIGFFIEQAKSFGIFVEAV